MDIALDVKDRRILYQLETNARQPISSLAKNVGLSREVVNYRIKQLEKKGIIQYYVATIDLIKLGLMYCRVFFQYNNVDKSTEEEIIKFSRENPYISWVALGNGQWDLALVYSVSNLNILDKNYHEFQYKFGHLFKRTYPSVAFKIYHYKHSYLYNHENDRTPIIVGDFLEIEKIDDMDWKILSELMKNPMIDYVNLAKILEISIKTVSKRIENLTKNKIILNFRAKINTKALNLEHHKIFLFLINLSKKNQLDLINYLQNNNNVIFITKPFGMADLEFEMVVEGQRKLYEFLSELKIKFPNLIRDYETFLLYDEPFTNYLPKV